MTFNKGFHLNEDQILRAVVDEADLPRPVREHLSTCPLCQKNKERLEQDLKRLGQMAERFSPLPGKRVSLPEPTPRGGMDWSWNRRVAFGVAAMTALLIIFVWWSPLLRTTHETGTGTLIQEFWESDRLMTDVSMLVENALPPVFLDITGEPDSEFDEEFMQFVVPPIESSSPFYESGMKGVTLC